MIHQRSALKPVEPLCSQSMGDCVGVYWHHIAVSRYLFILRHSLSGTFALVRATLVVCQMDIAVQLY